MLSSDDSFGWSAASDSKMSSSEDENASQASSVQDRKSQKKQLREYIMKNESKSDEVETELNSEEATPKKKKKKKYKRAEDNASYFEQIITNVKLEPDDTLNAKTKKKKIKSELEELMTHTMENRTPEKRSKKKKKINSELQDDQNTNAQVKQEESDSTSKTKIKKKRKYSIDQEVRDIETLNQSFNQDVSAHVKQEESDSNSKKKKKKNSELQDSRNTNAQVKQEESDSTSKKKKKKKRKHSIDREVGDIETLSQSLPKKCKGVNKSEEISVDENDSDCHHLNGTADDSTLGIQRDSPKKKKNISFSEVKIELSRKNSRVHFNDTQNTEEPISSTRKESFNSSSTIKSIEDDNSANRVRTNSIQSIGSNNSARKISTSTVASSIRRHSSSMSPQRSRKRSSDSSNSQSAARRSKMPEKVQSRRSSSSDRSSIAETHGRKFGPANKIIESTKRASLSERIRFEDDMNDSEIVSISRSNNSRLKFFLERNPKLEHIPSVEASVPINFDDEVWVLKCPKDYNHEKLKNMDISVEEKMKIKLDGQTYDGILQEETHRIAVLLPCKNTFQIRNIRPKGILTFRKRIPKVDVNEMSVAIPAETFIPLPETKRRHPLFGHDYRKFTKIPSSVAERLTETVPRKNLKSKFKYKEEKLLDTVGTDEPDSLTDEVLIKKKKKRKRKISDSESTETVVKKFKLDPDTKVWDSEKGIERSLFTF